MKRHEIIHSKIENIVKSEAESNQLKGASGKVPCGLCGKQISKKSMKVHVRVHTGENPYKCKFCEKAFKQKVLANRHELTHTGENQKIPEDGIQDENSATSENSA